MARENGVLYENLNLRFIGIKQLQVLGYKSFMESPSSNEASTYLAPHDHLQPVTCIDFTGLRLQSDGTGTKGNSNPTVRNSGNNLFFLVFYPLSTSTFHCSIGDIGAYYPLWISINCDHLWSSNLNEPWANSGIWWWAHKWTGLNFKSEIIRAWYWGYHGTSEVYQPRASRQLSRRWELPYGAVRSIHLGDVEAHVRVWTRRCEPP